MRQPALAHGDGPVTHPALSNAADRIGLGLCGLVFLVGLWLMAAPFIVGYQARSAHWTTGTVDEFAVGGAVAVVALCAVIVFLGGTLAEVLRRSTAPP